MSERSSEGSATVSFPWEKEFTVFAVYEDSLQPYSITVWAGSPEIAVRLAQLQCLEDNGAELVEEVPPDYGSCTLMGFQVVEGKVETVPFEDMPIEVGSEVYCEGSLHAPWTVTQILTDGPELRFLIEYGNLTANVRQASLTPYPALNL